jgi:hypothetical protein
MILTPPFGPLTRLIYKIYKIKYINIKKNNRANGPDSRVKNEKSLHDERAPCFFRLVPSPKNRRYLSYHHTFFPMSRKIFPYTEKFTDSERNRVKRGLKRGVNSCLACLGQASFLTILDPKFRPFGSCSNPPKSWPQPGVPKTHKKHIRPERVIPSHPKIGCRSTGAHLS